MTDRRTVFKATAALGALFASSMKGRSASAKTFDFDVENRGTSGRLERLPKLDLESRDDLFIGMRRWRSDTAVPAAMNRFNATLEANGHDPKKALSLDKIIELVRDDPVINTQVRIFLDAKRTAHKNYKREHEDNADLYLAEMESYDNRGPGTLELNPDLPMPKYTSHEIHQQPAGYVGSPFSGPVYHNGTNSFYLARAIPNKQDQHHTRLGDEVATPEDGRIDHILDMGCGVGQLTVALKERFPNAELWGGGYRRTDDPLWSHAGGRLKRGCQFRSSSGRRHEVSRRPFRCRYVLHPSSRSHGRSDGTDHRRSLPSAASRRCFLPH